jgi:hypothetical protein
MRRAAYVLFMILLIAAVCIIAGYGIFPGFGPKTEIQKSINIGFTSENISNGPPLYNFEDVAARINEIGLENGNKTTVNATQDRQILYIRGKNLNEAADAGSWMFAIHYENQSSVVTFDRYGESVVNWPSEFPGQEIALDRIKTPKELFNQNSALIFFGEQDNVTVSRELTLTGNNYTLTAISNDKVRILRFNAQSGALTSTND